MKSLPLFFFLLLLMTCSISAAPRSSSAVEEIPLVMPQISYILKLLVPPALKKSSGASVKCYYKGKPYSFNDENLAIITDKKSLFFTLIITQTAEMVIQKNQKKYFKRKKGVPFRWYNLELVFDNPFDPFICPQYHWQITPIAQEEAAAERIPDNALIIFLDSQLVENITLPSLEESKEREKKNSSPSFCTIYFPFITIKPTVTLQEWEKSINKHAIDLDIKTFHKSEEPIIQQVNQKHIIALPNS